MDTDDRAGGKKAARKPEPGPLADPQPAAEPAATPERPLPAHRRYVFAKNGVNDHGPFRKGDKARGAYSADLVAAYVAAGILVEAPRD